MRKMLFIYNPRAGKGMIRNSLSYILEEFSRHEIELTVHPTSAAKDAVRTAREHGRAYDMIVCSGGDGTLDEVVTGMMQGRFRTPVGYIPTGSTNDYANSLGIPREMTDAARGIAEGEIFSCDVGRVLAEEDRYFVYVAAFGAFTEVSYKTSQDMKNTLGHLAYLLEGARALPSIKNWKLRFHSKERSGEGKFLYGMITNSNSVGGFKGITGDNVALNDGLFEVTLIRDPETIVEWPNIINSLLTGARCEYVITFKTAKLIVEPEEEIAWTLDGEYGGIFSRIVIENIGQALPLILGKQPESVLEDHGGS